MSKQPAPPKTLGTEGRRWWRRVLDGFDLVGADLLLLEQLCSAADRVHEAQEDIRQHGVVLRPESGLARTNPACKVECDSLKMVLNYSKALGLDLESD